MLFCSPMVKSWLRLCLESEGREKVCGTVLPETRAAEGDGDTVVIVGGHVVEPCVGAEPVNAGGVE